MLAQMHQSVDDGEQTSRRAQGLPQFFLSTEKELRPLQNFLST
jgi:hypothetical protein